VTCVVTLLDDDSDDPKDYTKQRYKYSLKAVNPVRVSNYKTIKILECPQGASHHGRS